MGNFRVIQAAILALFLALSLASSGARADGATLHNYASDGTPSWADNPAYMDCGLKCVYLESVEKISIRSRHTIETLNMMKNIPAETSTDDTTQDVKNAQAQMNAIVPGMCDWKGGVTGRPESVKDCQIRWLKVQLPTLYQDRLAIRYNTSYAADLQDGKVPAVGVDGPADASKPAEPAKLGLFLNAVDTDYAPKTPIVTSMEQYKDIRDRVISNSYRDPRLTQITALSQQIEQTTNVSREEFVKTKEILKDPSDPKSGTYSIVQTNKDGTPQYDETAYNKAVRNRGKLLVLEPLEKARLEANLKEIGKLQRAQLTDQNATHEKIYTAVRASVLGAARQGLRKLNMIGPSAPRAPAPQLVSGPKPATASLSRAAISGGGASLGNVTKSSGNPGDDKDIDVPATAPAGSRPYLTVGYSDNVLGQEINDIERGLASKRGMQLEP